MAAPAPPKPRRKRRRTAPGFGDMPTGPRRVAVYLRRSTDDEHQPFSINAQDTALASYVTTQPGWTLVAIMWNLKCPVLPLSGVANPGDRQEGCAGRGGHLAWCGA